MEIINREMMQNISKDIPFYPDPTYRPPPKPVSIPMSEVSENIDIDQELNTNFEENSPFQEGVVSEMYQRPDKSLSKNLENWKVLSIQAGWYRNF